MARPIGFFGWIRRLFFGKTTHIRACSYHPCNGKADPRCKGHNCTNHCSCVCKSICIKLHTAKVIRRWVKKSGHDLVINETPASYPNLIQCQKCNKCLSFPQSQSSQEFLIENIALFGNCDHNVVLSVIES